MPGPSYYDTINSDKKLKKNISILIGKAERPGIEKLHTPGRIFFNIKPVNTISKINLVKNSKRRQGTQ